MTPGGALYLSWRVTEGIDRRDDQGRLYASFKVDAVKTALAGHAIELDERIVSASSRKIVHRLVARREDLEFRDPRQDLFTEQGQVVGHSPANMSTLSHHQKMADTADMVIELLSVDRVGRAGEAIPASIYSSTLPVCIAV